MDKSCKTCDHFVDVGHSLGVCRRYPVFQNRSPNERCGEFTPIDYGDPLPEMLALPVVEKPQTLGEMMGYPKVSLKDAEKAFDEAYEEMKPKRRGRPKKEVLSENPITGEVKVLNAD